MSVKAGNVAIARVNELLDKLDEDITKASRETTFRSTPDKEKLKDFVVEQHIAVVSQAVSNTLSLRY